MPLEGTLKIERFSKDVELNLLHVGIFTSFLSCLVYSGEGGGYHCLPPCTAFPWVITSFLSKYNLISLKADLLNRSILF